MSKIEEQLNILREVIETAYDIEHPDEDTKSYLFRKYRGRFAESLKKAQEEAVRGFVKWEFDNNGTQDLDRMLVEAKEYLKTLK